MQATSTLTFTLEQAKAQVPHAFNRDMSLPERVEAVALHGNELLELFQHIEVFLAIGNEDWHEFQSRNISQDTIEKGFTLIYDKKIDECRALIVEELQPIITEVPHLERITFAEIRRMNGLIPNHRLTTGTRAGLYLRMAKLKPEDYPKLCTTYYSLSVYEKLITGKNLDEDLESRLTQLWDLLLSHHLHDKIYQVLMNGTPGEFTRFVDALEVRVPGDVIHDQFQDPFGFLAYFCSFINACRDKWFRKAETKIYAPYTAICQSSGFGKTKLVVEAGQRHFHVVYLCLRDEGTPGQLNRTLVIAELFSRVMMARGRDQVNLYTGIYASLLKALAEFLDDDQTGLSPGSIVEMTADANHGGHQPFWQRVGELFEAEQLEDGDSNIERSLRHLKLLEGVMTRKECLRTILIVLDEAHILVEKENRFRDWRHSIQHFVDGNIFFLVLNTSSRLFNFTPAARYDSSEIVVSGEATLLPPYYLFPIGVVKALPDPAATLHIPFGTLTGSDHRLAINHADLVSQCRPIFARQFEEEKDRSKSWNSAVAFAEFKLLGTQDPLSMTHPPRFGLLATILARIVSIPIDNISGDNLVSSHMGTILGLTDDRTVLRVGYPVEPVLSEAAGRITIEDPVWDSALSELRTLLVSGRSGHCPGKGEQGEMVAMLSLLRAHDVAHRSVSVPDLSTPITVLDFLTTFLGGVDFTESRRAKRLIRDASPIPKLTDVNNLFLDGLVSFTRWKHFRNKVTRSTLREAFEQRLAIQCMTTNEGIDLIISVVLPTVNVEGGNQLLNDDMMSGIFVQVKNHSNPISNAMKIASSVGESAQRIFRGGPRHTPPILGIVWQVGGVLHGAPRPNCHNGEATVLLEGMEWCKTFLTDQTIGNLNDIAVRTPFEETIRAQMVEFGGTDLPELIHNIVLISSLE